MNYTHLLFGYIDPPRTAAATAGCILIAGTVYADSCDTNFLITILAGAVPASITPRSTSAAEE